jgi:hypothetical protein
MVDERGMTASRILRVREVQRRIALARVSTASRAEAEISARRDIVARLVADTLPQASSYSGVDFVARMHFAGRLEAAQAPLGDALCQARAASQRSRHMLQMADTDVEIATRMQAQDSARSDRHAQCRALEDLCVTHRPVKRGQRT